LLSNLLKNNILTSVILMLLLSVAGFFIVYNHAPFSFPAQAGGALYTWLKMNTVSGMLFLFFSFLSMAGGAFLFNYVVNNNETLGKPSLFPAFIAILISFEAYTAYDFHPAFLSNVLIIVGMMRMMKSYRVDDAKSMFFDGAFMISSATLIYIPSITLLPLVFAALIILRPFVWREWAMALLGMAAPHLITAGVMYLLGTLDRYYNEGVVTGVNILCWCVLLFFFCCCFLTGFQVVLPARYGSKKI
jgi:hypothetical protein